jgi:hypothetical protein
VRVAWGATKATLPPEWRLADTGGGCTAWERQSGPDRLWLITRDNDASAPDPEDGWHQLATLSLFANDEIWTWAGLSLDVAVLGQLCRDCYDRAVVELGRELGGLSTLDLLADNLDFPLAALRRAAGAVSVPRIVCGERFNYRTERAGGWGAP